MNKIATILILLFSITHTLSAQKIDTVTYNLQKREIGIDFQNLFKTSALGGSLVYKKRIGIKDSLSLNKTKAFRLRFGGFVDANINNKDLVETEFENIMEGNGIIESENNEFPLSHFNIFAMAGIEWQHQKKRIQYYGGFEMGYRFDKEKEIINASYAGNELIRLTSRNNRIHSVLLNGIGGCKFFLSPNFSIGIETSIESAFNITRYTTTIDDRQIESQRIVTTKNNRFFANFDYLNGLYVSYYY